MRLVVVKKVKTSKILLVGSKVPAAYHKDVKDMTDDERMEVMKYLQAKCGPRPTLSLPKKS